MPKFKEGADLNIVEDEIVRLMVRHGVMCSEVLEQIASSAQGTYS